MEKKMSTAEKFQYILATVIVAGFFVLMGILMVKTTAIPAGNGEIAYILFGALVASLGSVVQYFFGSSKGSADKNDLLKKEEGSPLG